MRMASVLSFGDLNSGLQIGVNHGSINAQLHSPLYIWDKLPVASGATFDSYLNQHDDECLLGTRADLLQEIAEWAVSLDGKCIYWLNGMAGTGKSTISRTLSKSLYRDGLLGATFFFRRGEGDCGNASKLFSTIARQLVGRIPKLIPSVSKEIYNDPDIASKSLKVQFDSLIFRPLLELRESNSQIRTVVIVIDALDECELDNDIRTIIQLLPQLRESKTLRLRVFLTSRPELPIRLGFSKIAIHDYQSLTLHEISETSTEYDITLFLQNRFAQLRENRGLPMDWPADDTIRTLVTMSVPLFITAATVCRYIEDPKWDPAKRLAELLEGQARYARKMDKTYLPILMQFLNNQDDDESEQLLQQFRQIIGSIALLAVPLSMNTLCMFLDISERVISKLLDSFLSVLNIPSDHDLPVRILHSSFRDFLFSSNSLFRVDEGLTHKSIAIRCFTTMRGLLKKNICSLRSCGTPRTEISNETIHRNVPLSLQYSCRYWPHHLAQSADLVTGMGDVLSFLTQHFLHWLEVMSILGLTFECAGSINLLQSVTHNIKHTEISEFLYDAKRFVLKNMQIVDETPLQLYCSGLVFAPKNTKVRKHFERERPDWILEDHSDWVNSLAFSPDGQILASGSEDSTIRLWDSATGAPKQVLKGHSSSLRCLAFSPDGQLLASGSFDGTVRLWNPTTGFLQRTLGDHFGLVRSLAFSPDGRLLASGSSFDAIRLWDPATGVLECILEHYLFSVYSVAFSPDGRLLASGSNDTIVRLWDPTTGVLQGTLEGHSRSIRSVAFSPDGGLLASGSDDRVIQLWDLATGTLYGTLEGHANFVRSVAFSPDGRSLVSGSYDRTIRLWDPATSSLKQILKGHLGTIRTIAMSPDGRLLVSGSDDNTIRLWDPAIDDQHHTSRGSSDVVQFIVFSSNGQIAASSTGDNTIQLWDPATGTLKRTFEGSGPVKSIIFSSDGRLLASVCGYSKICLWNTTTGGLQQTLEGRSGSVESLALSPDGELLASGSSEGRVRLWNTAATYGVSARLVTSSILSSISRVLAPSAYAETCLNDSKADPLKQALKSHQGSVNYLAFSPDGQILASGSNDNTVRLYHLAMNTSHTLNGHIGQVQFVVFSPDGQILASGSDDATVQLWNTAIGALQQTLKGHSGSIICLAFSLDGQLLASSSSDQTIRLWDTSIGAVLRSFRLGGIASSLQFSADGRYLSTNLGSIALPPESNDHASNKIWENVETIALGGQWVLHQGERVLRLPPEHRFNLFAFSRSTIALGDSSGRVLFITFSFD